MLCSTPPQCYLPTHTPSASASSCAGLKVNVSPLEIPVSAIPTYLWSLSLKVSMVASVVDLDSVSSWCWMLDCRSLEIDMKGVILSLSSLLLCFVAGERSECSGRGRSRLVEGNNQYVVRSAWWPSVELWCNLSTASHIQLHGTQSCPLWYFVLWAGV